MASVPDRFLGFAFSVGDVLVEFDGQANIVHIDGAAQGLLGGKRQKLLGGQFLDMLHADNRPLVERAMAALTGENRRGPLNVRLMIDGMPPRPMVLFLYRMPEKDIRYCAVLMRPSRLGLAQLEDEEETALVSDEARQEQFFDKLSSVMASADQDLLVTVLDSAEGTTLDRSKQKAVEGALKGMSVDGATATRLSENRFALVHDRSLSGELAAGLIANEINQATGVVMTAASIDAGPEALSEEDGLKALIHGLKQFAANAQGYGVGDISDGAGELISRSTARVKVFRRMISEGAFTLVYQPIVNLRSGKISHHEALSRFALPGLNESPFETISFAEDVGLIDAYDMAVLKRVIAQMRSWRKGGKDQALAVNVSGYSLSRTSFLIELMELLEEARDLSNLLALEVTESASISDLKELGDILRTIKNFGFMVYLDDFGAGASGFQYLRELKPDALKIDGSYIKDATQSATDRAFLKSMVMLCQDLGIRTVGEWIENEESASLLSGIGVDYGQGYFFGKPDPNLTQN